MLSDARSQTLYGYAAKDRHLGVHHHLDWETKTYVLAMIDGFADVVAERMEKDGKLQSWDMTRPAPEDTEESQPSS
jgi:hypothetical protein